MEKSAIKEKEFAAKSGEEGGEGEKEN